jgi:nucleotide-binding universal stress UspA family protein
VPDEIIQIAGLDAGEPDDAEAVLALRERAATALERALGFIDDYGCELARLRARVVLDAARPDEVIEAVAARQQEDGSFEPLAGVFSGALMAQMREAALDAPLVGTLEALAVLADVRALMSKQAERAVEYLMRVQRADGSWGHLDPVRDGDRPEDAEGRAVDDRLFATGMLAGYALRTPYVRPESIVWAGRFLEGLWAPERVEGGRLASLAAFSNFFANGGSPDLADAALQWCGRELERGFRSHRFEAVETLRVLAYCDARELPGATFDVVELLDRLLDEQAADGGMAALDPGGPPGRVAPTVDALMAIRALCAEL